MRTTVLSALSLALMVGCGIPGDTVLTDLETKDWELICDRAVDTRAEARTVTCEGFEVTIEPSTVQDCVDAGAFYTAATCAGTLDDWVSCNEEPDLTDDQVCGVEEYTPSTECTALAECIEIPA